MVNERQIAAVRTVSGLVFSRWLRYQTAMSDESIEGLARKLADAVPEGLRSVREDVERNFRSVLRGGLTKLDLVTREEFEVQEAVLARTREKLEALEKRLAELEK
jgi:BMFP domain-containing protein YqiC